MINYSTIIYKYVSFEVINKYFLLCTGLFSCSVIDNIMFALVMSKFCLVAVPHALISISHCLVFCLIFPQCPAPVGFNWKKEYLICTLILSSLQAPIPLPSSRSHSPRTATSTSILICPPSTANMVGNRYCCSLSLLLLSLWILLTPHRVTALFHSRSAGISGAQLWQLSCAGEGCAEHPGMDSIAEAGNQRCGSLLQASSCYIAGVDYCIT